ncbi:MAG: hypothetical protein GKR93_15850 [Gammaproteobacteria bacterium]|nr:hypothetical protein [Gammaproteobacteria bacterium]
MRNRFVKAIIFLLCLCGGSAAFAYYEARPVIRMSEVLTSQQAQSVYHRVDDIELDGKFYRFYLHSEMGSYTITSLALFRKRVQEIHTLAQAVNQFQKKDEQLSEEIGGQFSIRANSAMDIISRPVESAANLAGQVADNLNQSFSTADSSNARFSYLGQESKDPVAAMHKRNVASQWGFDVYSNNLNVQEFLNAVTRARSSGKISAGTPSLHSQLNRPTKLADVDVELNTAYLLKSKSIDELQKINRDLFLKMKINQEIVDKFFQHPAFSPRNQTRIAHYLDALTGVRNRSAFVEAASNIQNTVMALAFEESAMMLNYYHKKIAGLEKLNAGSEVLEAISKDRRMLYFAPVDMIYWSEETEKLFDELSVRGEKSGFRVMELITSGKITDEASKELKKRNFILRDQFVNK